MRRIIYLSSTPMYTISSEHLFSSILCVAAREQYSYRVWGCGMTVPFDGLTRRAELVSCNVFYLGWWLEAIFWRGSRDDLLWAL
jgi:hypothetical protein